MPRLAAHPWYMRIALCFMGLLAACGTIPRDPDGTLDRIRTNHVFNVGVVDGGREQTARAILAELSRDTRARAAIRTGQLEPLLLALEEGRLDLVAGARLDPDSPWAKRVTLGSPLTRKDAAGTQAFAITRNGENAWIILVGRAAKRVGTAR
jgi:hypothetical protein